MYPFRNIKQRPNNIFNFLHLLNITIDDLITQYSNNKSSIRIDHDNQKMQLHAQEMNHEINAYDFGTGLTRSTGIGVGSIVVKGEITDVVLNGL